MSSGPRAQWGWPCVVMQPIGINRKRVHLLPQMHLLALSFPCTSITDFIARRR